MRTGTGARMKKKLVEKKKLAAPLVNVFARWTFMAKQNTILYENRKVTRFCARRGRAGWGHGGTGGGAGAREPGQERRRGGGGAGRGGEGGGGGGGGGQRECGMSTRARYAWGLRRFSSSSSSSSSSCQRSSLPQRTTHHAPCPALPFPPPPPHPHSSLHAAGLVGPPERVRARGAERGEHQADRQGDRGSEWATHRLGVGQAKGKGRRGQRDVQHSAGRRPALATLRHRRWHRRWYSRGYSRSR